MAAWLVAAIAALVVIVVAWPPTRRDRAPHSVSARRTGATVSTSSVSGLVVLVGVGLLGLVVGMATASPTVAVMPGPIASFALLIRRRSARRASLAARTAAMSAFVDAVGVELRSGASLHGAVLRAMQHGETAALEAEFRALRDAVDAGVTIDAALMVLARTSATSELSLFATTAAVLVEHGGPVAPAIDRVGELVRSGQANDRAIKAQASQATASASVMAALPAVFGVTLALIDPRLGAFYLRSPIGTVCVAVSFGLVVAGWIWMDRVIWGRR